jgi:hypothetical protein
LFCAELDQNQHSSGAGAGGTVAAAMTAPIVIPATTAP